MGYNPGNHIHTEVVTVADDSAGDTLFNVWRAPQECRVVAVYFVNDANIATATNMLAVSLENRGTTGTETAATIALFASTAATTADVPRTGTLTASNQDIASGSWLAYNHAETGTGVETRARLQIDYILATGATT